MAGRTGSLDAPAAKDRAHRLLLRACIVLLSAFRNWTLLAQLLGVNFTYFAWPFGEVPYGMGVVLLILMMLISLTRINWWQWMLIGLLTFLVT
ncbi:MAG: hypothetical protein GY751_25525 [Bacteroidetes bacterium]|nr:hypothetical protein [Bacteroidota bacterium]